MASLDLAGMSPLLASSMKTLDGWAENLLEQLEAAYPEGCPPELLPPLSPGYTLQQSLADPNCSPFRQHTLVSVLSNTGHKTVHFSWLVTAFAFTIWTRIACSVKICTQYLRSSLYLLLMGFLPQTSLQTRILWHKLATETPISDYLMTKEPEVK